MEELAKNLKESRNNLSDSSIKTYKSILSNLYKKVSGILINDDTDIRDFFCKNANDVLKYLEDHPLSRRKTTLSALVVLCSNNEKVKDKYRAQLLEDGEKFKEEERKNSNVKSEKEEKNWVDWDEVVEIHNQLGKEVNPLFTKSKVSDGEFNKVQDYVLLSLYVLNDPRRSMDYASMRIKNINKKDTSENYMDKMNFIFNKYKTAGLYGQQKVPISSKLKAVLNKWVKFTPYEYLLVSPSSEKPLSVSQITHRLNGIFGKKVSSNMLRHSYLSHLYPVEKMKEIAHNMGHSVNEAIDTYAKK